MVTARRPLQCAAQATPGSVAPIRRIGPSSSRMNSLPSWAVPSAALRAHRRVVARAVWWCGPRRSRWSGRRGRRSCGCGRCRRAGPGRPAWPARPRRARRPRGAAGPGGGRRRCFLDRPDAVGPVLRVGPHRGVAGLVGTEPARAKQPLVAVDDLDRGRQLVGIDPDDHLRHSVLLLHLVPIRTARWAVLLRAGQSPFGPGLVTVPDGLQTGREPPDNQGGQPRGEPPAGHLDRVWPDTDPARKSLVAACRHT